MSEIPESASPRRRSPRLDLTALDPMWHRSRGWWTERSLREQVLIGSLAAVAILALLLVGILAPLRSLRATSYDQLHNAALLEAQLRSGSSGSGQHATMRHGTPSAILTDTIAAARLSIQRIEPEGGNTRVELGDAPFGQVMAWVADVERNSRLRVQQAQIDQKNAGPNTSGLVTASFVFSG